MFGRTKAVVAPSVHDAAARIIFDRSPDAYCVIDEGRIVECNGAMERFLDCSRADIIGLTPEQLSPPTQEGGVSTDELGAKMDALVARDGSARFEWTHQRLDGTPLPVLVTLIDANIGGRSVMISMWQDIGELVTARQTEKALQREQAKAAQVLSDVVADMGTALDALAGGNLSFELQHPFPPAFQAMQVNFNTAVGRLRSVLARVISSATKISNGLRDISMATGELAQRTEKQAASVEETAAALETLSVSVSKTAERTQRVHIVTASASSEAEAGGDVVKQAIASMEEIRSSSAEVAKIVGVIDDIAFQTNLLALNAAVEAARAGDAGHGFAVVAAEVRRLAQRATDAARSIKGLIGSAGEQVETGVKYVNEAGNALSKVAKQITEVNALVADVAASTKVQALEVDAVNGVLGHIDTVTQQNAAMVEKTVELSNPLLRLAEDLQGLVGQFQITTNSGSDIRQRARTRQ